RSTPTRISAPSSAKTASATPFSSPSACSPNRTLRSCRARRSAPIATSASATPPRSTSSSAASIACTSSSSKMPESAIYGPDPIRLSVRLVERGWGPPNLAPGDAESERPIGEAWVVGPPDLPLLVKLIFTSERLSVQVHPGDGEEGERGKTEMWHILDAAPGATIALGFREPITRERLQESSRTGEIEQLLNWIPVKAGE